MSRKSNVLFFGALAGSAAVHLLLLFLLPGLWENPQPTGDPILISLVQPTPTGAQPETKNVPVLQSSARRQAQTSVQLPPQPQPEPVKSEVLVVESPPIDSLPAAETSPVASEPETEAPEAEASTGDSVAALEPAVGEAAISFGAPREIATAQAPRASPIAAEGAMYRQLLDALRARIVDNIRYPALARSRGWKGTVLLLASLDSQGRLQDLIVRRSSGHSVLDQAATALVRRVTPIGNPVGRPLSIEIPIVYELTEK